MPIRLPPPLRFEPDELYRVPTRDGSAVALGRYRPRERRRYQWPIVFAHGLGTNRFSLDFNERYSLARAFARAGFETWVLEVRGHGLGGDGAGSTFDVEADADVEAALKAIVSTGAEKVGWVGHSRGGLLALAHLGRFPRSPIGAIATIASAVTYAFQTDVKRFVEVLSPLLRLPSVPLSLSRHLAPLGLPRTPISPYLLRAEHVEPEVVRQAIAHVTVDIPRGVARQFARWVTTDRFDGNDGFDYRAALPSIKVPVLLVAGAGDLLVPPAAGLAASRHLGGPVETLVVGRAHGFSVDAGHGDIVLGASVPEELTPRLIAYFARTVPAAS